MKTLPYLFFVGCFLAFNSSPVRAADSVSSGDKTFVLKAAQGGMT